MEKKELSIGTPLAVAGVTLIPIERVYAICLQGRGGISFVGTKEPYAVLVVSASARAAYRIDGGTIPLYELAKEVRGLVGLLEEQLW